MPAMSETPATDARREALYAWLMAVQPGSGRGGGLRTLAADASFRRYFRWQAGTGSYVAMDAPPEREGLERFVDVAARLRSAGLHAPEIHAWERERGFLLLEDLGDRLYRDVLDGDTVETLFSAAFDVLECFASRVDCDGLPDYDRDLLGAELELFPDWYLQHECGRAMTARERSSWCELCELLLESAQQQPQIFVHRDFHACNLLLTEHNPPGIIDFQDAVRGPVTYDLVSLLLDRDITWPRQRLEEWMEACRQRLAPGIEPAEWQRCCDWMGLQRNLKILGIFCRLNHRDGKPAYMELLPRFRGYVLDTLRRYRELDRYRAWLEPLLLVCER